VLEPASSNHPNEAIQLTLKPWQVFADELWPWCCSWQPCRRD